MELIFHGCEVVNCWSLIQVMSVVVIFAVRITDLQTVRAVITKLGRTLASIDPEVRRSKVTKCAGGVGMRVDMTA